MTPARLPLAGCRVPMRPVSILGQTITVKVYDESGDEPDNGVDTGGQTRKMGEKVVPPAHTQLTWAGFPSAATSYQLRTQS